MARKKDDMYKKIAIAALIGAGIYMLTRPRTAPPTPANFQQIPPAPPPQTQQWGQWVEGVLATFGNVAQLWQPGGPFYQQPITQQQATEISSGLTNVLNYGMFP